MSRLQVDRANRATATGSWNLSTTDLKDAYTDFVLSRRAMQCTAATLAFYAYTLGGFLSWIEQQNMRGPHEITARHVREFLAGLGGKSDQTIHDFARAIKTLLRFWHAESYMPAPVIFAMPRLSKKRLPVLSAEQLMKVAGACNVRDRAIMLTLADSGLRRSELCALNWSDLDFSTGLVRVRMGKGRKARSAAIGATTRRALLALRRSTNPSGPEAPVFPSQTGGRLTPWGLGLVFRRLTARTGIHISPHAMRRTFAILSLRAGMDSLHLQALGGWADPKMLLHYAALEDVDLLEAHRRAGPVDFALR